MPVLHRRLRTAGVCAGQLQVLPLDVWMLPDLLLPGRQGAVLRQLGAHRRDGKRSRVARHREEGIRQHRQRQGARHRRRAVRATDGLKGRFICFLHGRKNVYATRPSRGNRDARSRRRALRTKENNIIHARGSFALVRARRRKILFYRC